MLALDDLNNAVLAYHDSWKRYEEAKKQLWEKHNIAVIEGDPPIFLKIEDVIEDVAKRYAPMLERLAKEDSE